MATTSAMAFFIPAEPVYYSDSDDRQLDFTQTDDGNVSVRVRYGLSEINQVFQDRIFIRRNIYSIDQSFTTTHPVLKRYVLRAIANDKADVFTVNGPSTQVKKRKTVGDIFLHEIRGIILVLH